MKKIFMAIVLCLVCTVSLSAQNKSNTRIPTLYSINEYSAEITFTDGTFVFDTLTNTLNIVLTNDTVVSGEFKGVIHFYNAEDQLIKNCNVPVTGEGNIYTTNKCGCVIPHILAQAGYIQIEISLSQHYTFMCIVTCDQTKY